MGCNEHLFQLYFSIIAVHSVSFAFDIALKAFASLLFENAAMFPCMGLFMVPPEIKKAFSALINSFSLGVAPSSKNYKVYTWSKRNVSASAAWTTQNSRWSTTSSWLLLIYRQGFPPPHASVSEFWHRASLVILEDMMQCNYLLLSSSRSSTWRHAPLPAVGNLPYDVTEKQLQDQFAEVGPIKSFRFPSPYPPPQTHIHTAVHSTRLYCKALIELEKNAIISL